jgi:phosphoribosylformylglycinamidine synthase
VRVVLVRVRRPDAAPEPAPSLAAALAEVEVVAHAGGALRGDAALVLRDDAAEAVPDTAAELRAFAAGGGAILGIGAGFAALCEAGLLPGEVMVGPLVAAAPTHVRVEGRATPFTWAIPAGRVVALAGRPAARYRPATLPALEAAGQVILRYCDGAGGAARGGRGAHAVAGICDTAGRVVGLLSDPALEQQVIASLRLGTRALRSNL